MSISTLISSQNPDGGFPYRRGKSWTEPTVYATLALLAAGELPAARKGLDWIRAAQRPDGGFPPQIGIDESTWVTALVALFSPEEIGQPEHDRAIQWLLTVSGEESSSIYRVRQFLLGVPRNADQKDPGWPWMPGAASWVGPTSLAILALDRENVRKPDQRIRERVQAGRRFLLARMCGEGGWNHGSSRATGYESRPYPETTGMALAALRGVSSPKLDLALAAGKRFLQDCRSADARNWLTLGLLAHGQLPEGFCSNQPLDYRTLPETSLNLLVAGAAKGNNLFWS